MTKREVWKCKGATKIILKNKFILHLRLFKNFKNVKIDFKKYKIIFKKLGRLKPTLWVMSARWRYEGGRICLFF